MGRVNKRTSLAEPAQIASKPLSITSAFLPPASMESKGNEMVGSSEEELFMLSDESLAVCGGLREKWRGECAARVLDSPLTGKSFAPDVLPIRGGRGLVGWTRERAEKTQRRSLALPALLLTTHNTLTRALHDPHTR